MIKNVTKLEVKIGKRIYHFLCDVESPLGEVYDAISQMKGFVVEKIKQIETAPEPEKKDD